MAPGAPVMLSCTLVLPDHLAERLFAHLFPGDGDEHGAVLTAGIARSHDRVRLLGRELFLAQDGVDYVSGQRGYRMLRAEFITKKVLYCRDENLCYLAVHNHGGTYSVEFSTDDLESHERGYPALLDVIKGQPVGALVFARQAVAGDIWLSKKVRLSLKETRIIGPSTQRLYPVPPPRPPGTAETYDRQARIFGDAGQDLLSKTKVGIIGAGGVGSLIIEYLGRLGVGRILVVDPERIHITNLPRVVGSTRWDARTWLTKEKRPRWVRKIGERLATKKVNVMRRLVHAANTRSNVEAIYGNFVDEHVARRFTDCDFLFLAADKMQARLVFNAIVHQYLIPGIQVGSKVLTDRLSGDVIDVYSVSRSVTPDSGCLWCNGLISPSGLQREAANPQERAAQAYVEEETVVAPSVITLNATAASHAANDFLFAITGLVHADASSDYIRFLPRLREVLFEKPRKDPTCRECGSVPHSRLARGDTVQLPTG